MSQLLTQVQSLGWEDPPGEGNGYPLQYSVLEESMDCVVHEVAQSQTQLSFTQLLNHHRFSREGVRSQESGVCLQCRRPRFSPRVEKTPGEGSGSPLQYSCLEKSIGIGIWQAMVHGIAQSQSRLSDWRKYSRYFKKLKRALWTTNANNCFNIKQKVLQLF